jgi:hypothetical protein
MPFGLNSAPEEFQRRQNQMVEGLRGLRCEHDDFLIFGEGSTEEEAYQDHDNNFPTLIDRCCDSNLKLDKEKLKFRRKEVRFVGHLLTNNGVCVDLNKAKVVYNRPTPTKMITSRLSDDL